MEGRIVIKAELGNDVRKILIHNDEVTYDELAIMMQRIFKGAIKPDDEIILKYRDEDGDLVTLFDTSDVAFALQTSRQYLRIKLFLNGFERSLADNEVKDIKTSLRSMRDEINKILDRLGDEPKGLTTPSCPDDAESLPSREVVESRTPDVANVAPPDTHEFDPLDGLTGSSEPTRNGSVEPPKSEIDRASQYSGSEFGDQSHSFQQLSTTPQTQTQTAQQPQYNPMAQYQQQQQMYAASQASNVSASQTTLASSYGGSYSQAYSQAQSQAQPTQQSQQYYQSAPSSQANSSLASQGYSQAQQAYYQQMQMQQAQAAQQHPGQGQQQPGQGQQQPGQGQQQPGQGQQQPGQAPQPAQRQPGIPQAQMPPGYNRMPGPSNPYSKPGQLGAGYPRATGMYPPLPAQQYPPAGQPQYPAGQPGSVMNAQ